MKLQGTITALVTPFTRNGGVNYEKLAELIEEIKQFQIQTKDPWGIKWEHE